MKYIDIHTHTLKHEADIELVNLFAQNLERSENLHSCTAGFHPWHINDCNEKDLINELHFMADIPEIRAIGECGLDKMINVDMDVQKRIFLKQAGIAENKNKPLIIHCVKAFNELIELKKAIGATVPWIIHGYTKKPSVTKQLLKHGFYFSLGESLLHKTKLAESLKLIPIENLFFETDESDISIKKIYLFASQVLAIDMETLKAKVFDNYKRIFKHD